MGENQSPEFGINDGYPDSADLANKRLIKHGSVGRLVIKLTEPFDKEIDASLGQMGHFSYKKNPSPSGSQGNPQAHHGG